jgi:hypothetical protein
MKAVGCDATQLFLFFTAVDCHGSGYWKYRNSLLYALIHDCVTTEERWPDEHTYTSYGLSAIIVQGGRMITEKQKNFM